MKSKNTLLFSVVSFLIISAIFASCSEECETDVSQSSIPEQSIIKRGFPDGFPDVKDIVKNPTVIATMDKAWNKMKNFASGNGRCEFGFYIYYNKNTDTYSCGEIVQGPVIQGYKGTNANVSLGKVVNNTTVCAFFHCHTTLQYCPKETMRRTGPSSADKSFASKNKLPGILYDYAKREIRRGDSKDLSKKIYTFGPSKRSI